MKWIFLYKKTTKHFPFFRVESYREIDELTPTFVSVSTKLTNFHFSWKNSKRKSDFFSRKNQNSGSTSKSGEIKDSFFKVQNETHFGDHFLLASRKLVSFLYVVLKSWESKTDFFVPKCKSQQQIRLYLNSGLFSKFKKSKLCFCATHTCWVIFKFSIFFKFYNFSGNMNGEQVEKQKF